MSTAAQAASIEPAAQPTLTEGLVSLIRARPISRADLDAMASIALDGIANMLAGRATEPGRILRRWGAEKRDPGRRALVMGGCMHVLEVDDLHRGSVTHPGCVVIPAALALADSEGADGEAFLRAVLHGFEAVCRVGMSVGPTHYKVWHNTATCGPFGAAMAAASLIGLDDEAVVHALGNAGTQSAGLWEFLNTGAMSKHLHAGRAAEAGVVAAELAAGGFTGPPAILEGPQGLYAGACPDADPGAVLRHPDAPWAVHATSIKPWPSCRHTHPVIDAALELSARIDAAAVTGVEASTYRAAVDVCDRPMPASPYEAKFSLQHCIAAALTDGAVGFETFEAESRARLAALRSRVRVGAGTPYVTDYPAAWGGEVTAILADGSRASAARRQCKGDPEAALDRGEMADKARELLRFGRVAEPEAVIDGVLAMAGGGTVPAFDI
ncbi:MAG: MmgE/PrpD family protein [Defluviicoccus sp.]|nr:MmgE/PrpD family protein [Defluviicoccus sp.]MDE0385490.1 MmgE/PrpD family protein [Defluviicoccus sp.]